MTHTALARKYRPTRFADLVAQEHVATGLAGAVAKGRVAHGYLLTGPRGVGKTSAARILAMALNCERRDQSTAGEPCGECEACRRIWSGSANLDVVEIDAASHRGVDDARELRERAMYAASGPDGYKVYIVDEAHMLTREAWNALLKVLEEPPPRVVFVFATTEPQKIANTTTAVLSRLQRFDFRSIGPRAIAERLRQVAQAEGIEVEEDALVLVSRVANGAMRDALSVLDQVLVFAEGPVSAAAVRSALGLIDDETYAELLRIIADRQSDRVFPFVATLVEQGSDLGEFVNGMGDTLRALMVTVLGGPADGVTDALREGIESVAGEFTAGDLLRMLSLLEAAEGNIRRSPNVRLSVETLLLRWTLLDRTVELTRVIEALGNPPPAAPNPAPPRGRRTARPASAPPAASPPPAPPDSGASPVESSADLGRLEERWPAVVDAVATRSPIVREGMRHAKPVRVTGDQVVLAVDDQHVEGLRRRQSVVQDAITQAMGKAVRVVWEAAAGVGEAGAEPAPKRRTAEDDRESRLRAFRQADPGLDSMADALDLELAD